MMGRREREQGAAFQTHRAYFENTAPKQDVLIIENVPEYSESLVMTHLQKYCGDVFALHSIRLDPRMLGMGAARARVFMVCYNKKVLRWIDERFTLTDLVKCLASKQLLTAEHYFWAKIPPKILTKSEDSKQHAEHTKAKSCCDVCLVNHILYDMHSEI